MTNVLKTSPSKKKEVDAINEDKTDDKIKELEKSPSKEQVAVKEDNPKEL